MENDDGGDYCLPGYMKDRLMRSYESEMEFYREKIDLAPENTDARVMEQFEERVKVAEDNLKTVEAMAVCGGMVDDDTDVPAEEPNVDLDPLSQDDE